MSLSVRDFFHQKFFPEDYFDGSEQERQTAAISTSKRRRRNKQYIGTLVDNAFLSIEEALDYISIKEAKSESSNKVKPKKQNKRTANKKLKRLIKESNKTLSKLPKNDSQQIKPLVTERKNFNFDQARKWLFDYQQYLKILAFSELKKIEDAAKNKDEEDAILALLLAT